MHRMRTSPPPPYRRLLTCVLLVVALASASCASADPDAPSNGGDATEATGDAAGNTDPVRIGFLYDVHAANVWTLPACESAEFEFELVTFRQFAEVQRAFQAGDIDVASMGYQNLAQMVGDGFSDFKAISGVYTGSEHITLGEGVAASDWPDLAGTRVGVPPNSFVEMLFRAGAEVNGLDIDSVELVPFPGAGPPLLTALEAGDVDVMVAWEPNSATAAVDGYGSYPEFDLQDPENGVGNATGVMYASDALIADRPDATLNLVNCMQERTDVLSEDVDAWVQALQETTGLEADVAELAVTTGEMDTAVYLESAQRIVEVFAENGLVEDVSDQVPEYIDYSFLEEVTGLSSAELGGSDG